MKSPEMPINRDTDIIKPLSETLHINIEHAEDMLNKLNKIKGMDDIEGLSFILGHFEMCLEATLLNKKLVKQYDRLSGQKLEWAMHHLTTNESLPPSLDNLCTKEIDLFVKDCLVPTIWTVYYRAVFDKLPNRKAVNPSS